MLSVLVARGRRVRKDRHTYLTDFGHQWENGSLDQRDQPCRGFGADNGLRVSIGAPSLVLADSLSD